MPQICRKYDALASRGSPKKFGIDMENKTMSVRRRLRLLKHWVKVASLAVLSSCAMSAASLSMTVFVLVRGGSRQACARRALSTLPVRIYHVGDSGTKHATIMGMKENGH
jgi:hypothetical protein